MASALRWSIDKKLTSICTSPAHCLLLPLSHEIFRGYLGGSTVLGQEEPVLTQPVPGLMELFLHMMT